jgi:hypothetical protein
MLPRAEGEEEAQLVGGADQKMIHLNNTACNVSGFCLINLQEPEVISTSSYYSKDFMKLIGSGPFIPEVFSSL